jgi:hypothetical protein
MFSRQVFTGTQTPLQPLLTWPVLSKEDNMGRNDAKRHSSGGEAKNITHHVELRMKDELDLLTTKEIT